MPTLSVNGDNGVVRMFPCGTLLPYLGLDTPAGFLECNGQAVSRAGYPELFNVLGTTYGEGDGVTTFNLPDFRNRVMQGAETPGTTLEAGLPNITGLLGPIDAAHSQTVVEQNLTGAFTVSKIIRSIPGTTAGSTDVIYRANFNASRSSAIYGKSTTVQPPAITVRMLVQY